MAGYKLDKTYFKAQFFKEADIQKYYWQNKDVSERLKAAWYLISCAYQFPIDNPTQIDKSVFSMRKHKY